MSNRNYLSPNINPTVSPEFKGDVSIQGDLTVTGIVNSGSITTGDVVSSSLSTGVITAGDLEAAGTVTSNGLEITINAQLPSDTLVGTASPNLITFGGDVPTIQTPGTVSYFSAPRAGRIIGIAACPQAAIATADATLIAAINGTNITNGTVTLPLVGTAAGDPSYASPTALNTVALNDIIRITVGGGNSTNTTARVTFTLQY